MSFSILQGDNRSVIKQLVESGTQVDAVVTDPPYGLQFMNKHWDYDVPSVEFWKLVYAVLKPGGHVLSFGGTRTYHRMVVNIEDAGFEIRDQILWLYGSGFPKSMDISKAIDKAAGAEREVVGPSPYANKGRTTDNNVYQKATPSEQELITLPATNDAKMWEGWGTALKPAVEPICLARKPLEKDTVAANVLEYQTGGLNIDGCRIGTSKRVPGGISTCKTRDVYGKYKGETGNESGHNPNVGRFPANVILDEEAGATLDEQSGVTCYARHSTKRSGTAEIEGAQYHGGYSGQTAVTIGYSDKGGASRFFYCAKASKKERRGSKHPTIKPVALMRYLCRLITPKGGTVLDPFAGSGTTGEAAVIEGFNPILIELEAEYVTDMQRRMNELTTKGASLAGLFEDDEEVA